MAAGRAVVVVVAALALVGCAGPLPWVQPTPTPRVVDCEALAKKGVRPCPPDSPALQNPQVVNRTQGHVPDATVQRWAWTFLREEAYVNWAMTHNSPELLRAGILASTDHLNEVYGYALQVIQQARTANGHLQLVGPTIFGLDIVSISPTVKTSLAEAGYRASDYGLVFRARGPLRIDLVSGNSTTTLRSAGSDGSTTLFEWGAPTQSPLGPVWKLNGLSDCASDPQFVALCG